MTKEYRSYMGSAAWGKRKGLIYRTMRRRQPKGPLLCEKCGKPPREVGTRGTLHHISYSNLGRETKNDVLFLCWHCHKSLHNERGRASK